MKISGAKKVHYEAGPNMTPLVDVVMVILIFLMLAGSFGGETTFLMSKQGIKKSGGVGRPLKPGEVPDTPLEVRVANLDPTGNNPGFVATGTGLRPTHDIDAVKSWFAGKRAAYNKAGTSNDKILVTLSPTRDVKYKYLIDVYQAAMQAGYEKIAFTTSH
jgi:biopolymer transport protein ExbD